MGLQDAGGAGNQAAVASMTGPGPGGPSGADTAPGAPPFVKLVDAVKADPFAQAKYDDVMSEGPPANALVGEFVAGAEARLQSMPDKPTQAMRDEISKSGDKYLCKGSEISIAALLQSQGISRLLDLPGIFNHGYLNGTAVSELSATGLDSEDGFVNYASQGKFDPNAHLDETKELRGKVAQTWWFPGSLGAGLDLKGLRDACYIQDDPAYAKGVVRLDMSAEAMAANEVQAFKPTAFDGLNQGWGNDPWWVRGGGEWGITKNNTAEAVVPKMVMSAFKTRSLIMPTAVPPLPATANSAATAASATPGPAASTPPTPAASTPPTPPAGPAPVVS